MNQITLEYIFSNFLIPTINIRRRITGEEFSPVLIIMDGHSSRSSGKLFSLCMSENIDLLCLPSHISHIIQPLDCGVNALFKNTISFNKNYENIINEKSKRVQFSAILKDAIQKALSPSLIIHSWKITGNHPFNPYFVLSYTSVFLPEYLKTPNINSKK
jgi:hypothetical protein